MIFQNPQTALHPFWRVGDIVGEAVKQQRPGITTAEAQTEGLRWLERVRLRNVKRLWTSHPHELSGGMAQRVMIAAALARVGAADAATAAEIAGADAGEVARRSSAPPAPPGPEAPPEDP